MVRLRWGAAASEFSAAMLAQHVFEVPLRMTPLLWLVALAALSNVAFAYRVHRGQAGPATVAAVLLFDTLSLGAMLAVSGGPANPFSILFLVYVTLSAVMLQRRWTWWITGCSILAFAAQFLWHVPVPELSGHGMHDMHGMHGMHGGHGQQGFAAHLYGMVVAFTVAAVLVAAFVSRTAEALRRRDQELSAARARAERLASLSALAGGAAHELGSPLGTIAVAAKELERSLQNAAADEGWVADAQLVRSEVQRCRDILDRMSAEAGEYAGEPRVRVAADVLANEAAAELSSEQRQRLRLQCETEQALDVPRRAFVGALVNLLRNAFDASAAAAPVTLHVTSVDDGVRFEVSDEGHGMPDVDLQRAVEPFFTTKEPGRGMGLGLFLVDTLVQRMGGRFAIQSTEGVGTRCTVEVRTEA